MRPYHLALAAASCFAATTAYAAGVRFIDVPADGDGPALTGAVWSPCTAPAEETRLRWLTAPGVKDCPIGGERLPLVVISHGRTGSFEGHHDTAETLADAGFVVAAIDHPGDNTLDRSRSKDLSVYIERPADIKRLVDFMLRAWPEAIRIDRQRIGFFGFSRGGYTGLVGARRGRRSRSASRFDRTRVQRRSPTTRASRPPSSSTRSPFSSVPTASKA
jgi:predicted dienelactone hydrolase